MKGSHFLLTTKFLIQVHNQICFFDCTHNILLLTIIVNGQLSPKISFHQECKKWHMSKLPVSPPMDTSIHSGEPRNKYFRYFSQSLIYKNRKTKECACWQTPERSLSCLGAGQWRKPDSIPPNLLLSQSCSSL